MDNSAGCSLLWGAPNPTLSHRGAPHHGETHPGPSKGMGDVPRMGPGLCCEHPKILAEAAPASLHAWGTLGDTKPCHLPWFQLCAGKWGGRDGSTGSDRSIN